MATDEQRTAVQAMLKRSAAIGKSQQAALREMHAVGSTAFRYGDQLVQLLRDDIELFRLAQAAVATWRPGPPPADLRGGRSYLVGMTRAVKAVEVADPSGNFLTLRERVEASARRWAAAPAVGEHDAVFAFMSADLEELDRVLGPVRAAVHDYISFLEEEQVGDLVRGFQEAARSTPGLRGRIIERVVGPAGEVTVVRDDWVEGPSDGSPDTGIITPAEHAALGLDDAGMEAAWPGFLATQMRATLQQLRLSQYSPAPQVHAEFVKRAGRIVTADLMIAEQLRSTPASLLDLRPGDIFGLRGQLIFATLEALWDVGGVPNPSLLPMVIARQFATAAPFFIERAAIDRAAAGGVSDLRLPAPACFVFHDAVPLPAFPDVHDLPTMLGEVLFADDDLRPLPMCLCIIGYPAQAGEETPGPRAVLAATSGPIVADLMSRIRHLLATTDWIRPPRRKLPGRPGSDKWKTALAAVAHAELADGSLAQVRTTR